MFATACGAMLFICILISIIPFITKFLGLYQVVRQDKISKDKINYIVSSIIDDERNYKVNYDKLKFWDKQRLQLALTLYFFSKEIRNSEVDYNLSGKTESLPLNIIIF